MAVGQAVVDEILSPGFLDHVRRVGLYARQRLAGVIDAYPDVFAELRGEGLLIGLRCLPPVADVAKAMREQGLLAAGAGENVVRLLPPLIVTEADMDDAVGRIEKAAAVLSSALAGARA
jgi:acetylornithine/N-succinyldiaminopimelate aminotransferase